MKAEPIIAPLLYFVAASYVDELLIPKPTTWGVFNFMLPHNSGFVYEINRLSKEAESIQKRAAKKAFRKFGGKLLSFIPGAEAAIANVLLLFIQNPGIILPIFTPIIGGIVMAFNTVMDEIGKII